MCRNPYLCRRGEEPVSILVTEDGGEAAGAVLRAERVERVERMEEGVMRADGSSGRVERTG